MVGIGDIKTVSIPNKITSLKLDSNVLYKALEFAKQQAQGLYGQDMSAYIQDFMIEIVTPWQEEHICQPSSSLTEVSSDP